MSNSFDDKRLYAALLEAVQYGGGDIFHNNAQIAVNLLRDFMPDARREYNAFQKIAAKGYVTALWQSTTQTEADRAYAHKSAYAFMTEQEFMDADVSALLLHTIQRILDGASGVHAATPEDSEAKAADESARKLPLTQFASVLQQAAGKRVRSLPRQAVASMVFCQQDFSLEDCYDMTLPCEAKGALEYAVLSLRDGDYRTAEDWFSRAAAARNWEAERRLVHMDIRSDALSEAFTRYNQTCRTIECPPTLRTLGYMYRMTTTDGNSEKLWELGAQKGDPGCAHNLAILHLYGLSVTKDVRRAVDLMQDAWKTHHYAASAEWLAYLCQQGTLVKKSPSNAAAFLRAVTTQYPDYAVAKMKLAICYHTGNGVEKSPAVAKQMLLQAEKSGNRNARALLAYLEEQIDMDACAAFEWRLGMLYHNGEPFTGQQKVLLFDEGIYDGNWKNGIRCGNGVLEYADGRKYDGTWFDGKRLGVGKLTCRNSKEQEVIIYSGEWSPNATEKEKRIHVGRNA